MRKNLVSRVLRTSAFATACLALAGPNVLADGIMTSTTGTTTGTTSTGTTVAGEQVYSTSGSVGNTGISAPAGQTPSEVISFVPTANLSYNGTSAISVGQFQVATLAAGQETDYNGTPFKITYNPVSFGSMNYASTSMPIVITGTLTGYVTGSSSHVVASFDSISNPAWASPDGMTLNTLSIADNPLHLVAPSAGGDTSVQALVVSTTPIPAGSGGTNPPNTPEPTTLAILATALVGLGLRKQLRKARLAL